MFDMGEYGSGARFVLETSIKMRKGRLTEFGDTPRHARRGWAAGIGCDYFATVRFDSGAVRH
jgi:hypothetical protein